MSSLFAELARQASAHARREVETYAREIPEFAFLDTSPKARAETMEHAVWFRRRTIELAPGNDMLTAEDLGHIASMGEFRAEAGMSLESRGRILRVHTALMLREINEAAEAQRGGGIDELMRVMSWFAPQGERGIGAYRQGFLTVLRRRMPYVAQVALLARSLLSADPGTEELARLLDLEPADHYAVTVIRVPDLPTAHRPRESDLEALVSTHRAPVIWRPEPGELIALVPDTAADTPRPPAVPDHVPDRALDLLRDFALTVGRPCAAGTATAPRSALADALDRARRISAAAPPRRASARLRPYTMVDVFVELAVADVPSVDRWLHTVARHLEGGPDLLVTLDAYYRHDMNRAATATVLNVHPRTLDYRLRRVRDLTGIDPASTHGVRVLDTAVTRHLSGAWR
ncbi:PucR family transcriptional regulator [Streptomyces sp. NPDC057877]|uniref:PucR family transcriptional regulator n=1 Tax=Streptomyces sp. NPDC057877 TaxID=3346269 RepID=UPI0036768D0B